MTLGVEAVVLARVEEVFTTRGATTGYRLEVRHQVKGDLPAGTRWDLPALRVVGADYIREVYDDVILEEGSTYLLFLSRTSRGWRPFLQGYGIFEEVSRQGQVFLVPLPYGGHTHILPRPDGQLVEPLGVFYRDLLLQHLDEVVNGKAWQREQALAEAAPEALWPYIRLRAAPDHCSYLESGGIGFRWKDFPGTPLPVHYPAAGDSDCSPASLLGTYVTDAVQQLNTAYGGVQLSGPSPFSGFTPDCAADNSAYGLSFRTWVNANLGGIRHEVLQANDPCNEIANLVNCAGTLAFGGMYGFNPTYTYDNKTYYQSGFGYVVLNNSMCSCLSPDYYTLVVAHEFTHSLGLGHIESNFGVANMNPFCCEAISQLDIDCAEYLYASPPLPVSWASFELRPEAGGVRLDWRTGAEEGNAAFVVERSRNARHWEDLQRLPGGGTLGTGATYRTLDPDPLPGLSYYRIRQEDFSGRVDYSPVRSVDWQTEQLILRLAAGSTAVAPRFELHSPDAASLLLEVFRTDGGLLGGLRTSLQAGLQVVEWPGSLGGSGVYRVRATTDRGVTTGSFFLP